MPLFNLYIIENFLIQKPDIMKKIIFAILLLVGMAAQGQAQEKGRLWIGGSIGVSSGDTNAMDMDNDRRTSQKSNSYSIQPELGYAFSDRWAVGIRLGIGQGKTTYSQDDNERKDKSTTFGVAPFVRYTCFNRKRLDIFVDGGLAYNRDRRKYEQYNPRIHYTSNSFGIFMQPGFSFRLSPCISLTGRLDFLNVYYKKTETNNKPSGNSSDSKEFVADLNSPFNLGNFTVGFNFSF